MNSCADRSQSERKRLGKTNKRPIKSKNQSLQLFENRIKPNQHQLIMKSTKHPKLSRKNGLFRSAPKEIYARKQAEQAIEEVLQMVKEVVWERSEDKEPISVLRVAHREILNRTGQGQTLVASNEDLLDMQIRHFACMPLESALHCWAIFITQQMNPEVIKSAPTYAALLEGNLAPIIHAMQSGNSGYLNELFARYNPTQVEINPFKEEEIPPTF